MLETQRAVYSLYTVDKRVHPLGGIALVHVPDNLILQSDYIHDKPLVRGALRSSQRGFFEGTLTVSCPAAILELGSQPG